MWLLILLPGIVSTEGPGLETWIRWIVGGGDDHPVQVGQHRVGAVGHLPLHCWPSGGDAGTGGGAVAGGGQARAGATSCADGRGGVGCGQAAKASL